ncbi:MAG: DUF4209 domain-containing protein [Sandaracinaceae bacterium]
MDFLALVDVLPVDTPPHALANAINSTPEAWRNTGHLDAVSWALYLGLHTDDAKAPLGKLEPVLDRWAPFHDDLAAHGPPEFRARFCDVLWTGRRKGQVDRAVEAVGLYVEAAKTCAKEDRFPSAGNYLRRALFIARQLKREDLHEGAREAALAIMRDEESSGMARWIVARTFAAEGDELSREIAELLEGMIDRSLAAAPQCDWQWLRAAARVVADAWKACGEAAAADTARKRAAELHVQQGDALEAADSQASLIADCYSRGVRALRDLGCREEAEATHRRLLDIQKRIPSEMGRINGGSVDLTEQALAAIEAVKGKPLLEQLLALCASCSRGTVVSFREYAEASAKQHVFQTLIPFQAVDGQGRQLKSAADPIERMMLEHAATFRSCTTIGTIQPARRQIALESAGSIEDWIEVLRDRPLVDHERIIGVAKGLSAGLAGDWIVASSILIPQFEFLIRRLLGELEELTSTLNADGTQREKLFSELLKKPRLTEILGEDWVFDLTSFLVEPGGNLRNKVAHGMVTDAQFHTIEGPYLWYLTIELVLSIGVTRTAPDPRQNPAGTEECDQ